MGPTGFEVECANRYGQCLVMAVGEGAKADGGFHEHFFFSLENSN